MPFEGNPFSKVPDAVPVSPEQAIHIPESEYVIHAVRSSGAGGQNVNKVSSKAELRFHIDDSKVLTVDQKEKIKAFAANRINALGELILTSQESRSQLQNKRIVVERLHKIVQEALTPVTERVATKPTKGSKERRLAQKEQHSRRKEGRKKDWGE